MFSQVSYNVVVERFKAFASGHYLIKRFSHGQIDVTDIMKDAQYPWMHIVPVSMNPSTGSRSFSFDIIFADLPRDKGDKTEYQRESLSDCMRLAEDLLAEIQNGNIIFGEDVELEQGASISPFMEEYTHVLTGVTLSLTMTFPWDWNACEIPADWSAGGTGSGGTGGGGGVSLILKVNGVENNIQTILDMTAGANMTITDLGDGRVKFDATGDLGTNWGTIGGLLADQIDLQSALNLKADISSLADVAFSGDYSDLVNTPTIPSVLDDLTDVDTTGQVFKNVLYYNGTQWIPFMLASVAYSGSYADLTNQPVIPKTIADLIGNGVKVGDIIQWNGTAWVVQTPSWSLEKLSDVNVVGVTAGQVLTWDAINAEWIPTTPSSTSPSLQDVTDVGNSTTNNIDFIDTAGAYFDNGSRLVKGTTDAGNGGNKGIAQKCSADYEHKWEAGRLYIMEQNGFTIREVSHNFTFTPTINDDSSKGYVIGSRWILDNGDVYVCADDSAGSAVWNIQPIGDMTKAVYDTDADGVVDSAERVQIVVRNQGSATLLKGQVVYLSGATGNRPNAVLADASTEATSSKTIGLVIADIGGNSDGQIAVNGTLHDLDTSAFNEGDTLWLSETAGEVQANTPPAEPAHAVFIGYVARSHPNFGRVVIQIQNGYELNELHGVQITSENVGDVLYYDGSLWVNQSLESNVVVNSSGVQGTTLTDALDTLDANKVDANTPILSGTATKVVYDSQGLIISGGQLSASDIPFNVDAIRIGTGVVNNTEFGHLDGVSSNIQTQLSTLNSGKVNANTPITPQTATKITYDAKGLVTGGSSLLASDIPTGIPATSIGGGTIDNTEFGFLNGVTSNIQTQINALSLPTIMTRGTAVASVNVNATTATSCNITINLPSGTADRVYYIEACWAIQPVFNPTSGGRVGFLWSGSIANFHGVYQGSQSEIAFRNGQVLSLGSGSLFPSNTPYLANDITRNATAPTIFKGYCEVVANSTTALTLALASVTLNQTISFQPRGSYLRAIRVS